MIFDQQGDSVGGFTQPALPQHGGQLAICDKAAPMGSMAMNAPTTMPMPLASSDTPLDPSVLKKVDDSLVWWGNVRKQAKSVMDATASNCAAAPLRQQLQTKLQDMFQGQVQLERIKMFGGHMSEIKGILNTFLKELAAIHDILKGMTAMT